MSCPAPIVAYAVNYLTLAIPVGILITTIIHSQRDKILGGLISKPSYQLGTAYALNTVYVLTAADIFLVVILFFLGPVIVPGEYATCVSPLA